MQKKEFAKIIGGFTLVIILFLVVLMTYLEIKWLYVNADTVTCDNFGRCVFTQTLRETEQKCYQNGKLINCSEIPGMEEIIDVGYEKSN